MYFQQSSHNIHDQFCLSFFPEEPSSFHSPLSHFNLLEEPNHSQAFFFNNFTQESSQWIGSTQEDHIFQKLEPRETFSSIQVNDLDNLPFNNASQQNLQSKSLADSSIKDKKKLNKYYLGHIEYLRQNKWLIFGRSRRYERTKRRLKGKKSSEFKAIAKTMSSKKNRGYKTNYSKRFDQQLNDDYRKLDVQCQQQADITPSALHNIISNKQDSENKTALDLFLKAYNQKRYWAEFLAKFVNEEPAEDEIGLFD